MKKERIKWDIGGLLALVLFGVFAVCVLSVLLLGADTYRRLTQERKADCDSRTAAQYISTRVHQADGAGQIAAGVFVAPGISGDTLHLYEEIQGECYVTRIYCCDGYLRELFAAAGEPYAPEDGEKIVPAQQAAFSCENGMLTVELVDANGEQTMLRLGLRSGKAVEP